MKILVIGSFMMDLVVRTNRAPQAGETIVGNSFGRFPGGKGANQAVAAARLGGKVTFAGRLGSDAFGEELLETMKREHIDTEHILIDETTPTGIASIVLEASGENRIIIVPGANLAYSVADVRKLEPVIKTADIMIMQLEMDLTMTEEAIAIAHRHQVPVILNPAPARTLSDRLLSQVTYLTPNETELEILSGMPVNSVEDAEKAAAVLLKKGVKHVVVTLAAKGALIVDSSGSVHVEGFPATPIDTVAAGDSFNGAMAFQLASNKPLVEAVRFANAVGSITVTREGAIPSLPTYKEVVALLAQHQKGE